MGQIFLQNAIAILLQNATKVYYKIRQNFHYKMQQFYCKMRQLLQNATTLLQNGIVTSKCVSTFINISLIFCKCSMYKLNLVKLNDGIF